jgi:predicted HicB family RNase H-like nuclease
MKEILHYKGYTASVHFSVTDGVFYGKIVGIDDLVSFEGASEEGLKGSFIEAVDDYIETCKQIVKKPNET